MGVGAAGKEVVEAQNLDSRGLLGVILCLRGSQGVTQAPQLEMIRRKRRWSARQKSLYRHTKGIC